MVDLEIDEVKIASLHDRLNGVVSRWAGWTYSAAIKLDGCISKALHK